MIAFFFLFQLTQHTKSVWESVAEIRKVQLDCAVVCRLLFTEGYMKDGSSVSEYNVSK